MSQKELSANSAGEQNMSALKIEKKPARKHGQSKVSKPVARPQHPIKKLIYVRKWWEAKCVQYAFTHPHTRARLEKLMGSNLVRLTDKEYMQELQQRIRAVNEEGLEKRIAARELDEMERLKRLILSGKTPLRECPPELYRHPVFVFWRLVDSEVARASQARADAYYKKLRAFQQTGAGDGLNQGLEEEEAAAEELPTLDGQELLQKCREEIELQREEAEACGYGSNEKDSFESDDVKRLKKINTVEELYELADQIIGVPRTL